MVGSVPGASICRPARGTPANGRPAAAGLAAGPRAAPSACRLLPMPSAHSCRRTALTPGHCEIGSVASSTLGLARPPLRDGPSTAAYRALWPWSSRWCRRPRSCALQDTTRSARPGSRGVAMIRVCDRRRGGAGHRGSQLDLHVDALWHVEDEDCGVLEDGAGDGDALPLPPESV